MGPLKYQDLTGVAVKIPVIDQYYCRGCQSTGRGGLTDDTFRDEARDARLLTEGGSDGSDRGNCKGGVSTSVSNQITGRVPMLRSFSSRPDRNSDLD